jgi:hypothetical protein
MEEARDEYTSRVAPSPQLLWHFGTQLVIEPTPGQLSSSMPSMTRPTATSSSPFWHGYYDQNQYLPLVLTCAENDQFVLLSLRPGNVHAALGADDDLEYLVNRLRRVWPDVVLHFRGDRGCGVPVMYNVCERLRVLYTFGLSTNAVLQRETEGLLAEAVAAYDAERQAARQQEPPRPPAPSRLFTGFWYQAGTWSQPRWAWPRRRPTRWRRKWSSARGGSWCGCRRAGRTWIGIAACASACVTPSGLPLLTPLADLSDSPSP